MRGHWIPGGTSLSKKRNTYNAFQLSRDAVILNLPLQKGGCGRRLVSLDVFASVSLPSSSLLTYMHTHTRWHARLNTRARTHAHTHIQCTRVLRS